MSQAELIPTTISDRLESEIVDNRAAREGGKNKLDVEGVVTRLEVIARNLDVAKLALGGIRELIITAPEGLGSTISALADAADDVRAVVDVFEPPAGRAATIGDIGDPEAEECQP